MGEPVRGGDGSSQRDWKGPGNVRVSLAAPRVIGVTGFSFMALISGAGLGSAAGGSRIFAGVMAAVSLFFVVRSCVSATVVLTAEEIRARSLFRTRRVSPADVDHVEVAVGITGMNSGRREYPVFVLADNSSFALKEINCRPGRDADQPTVVRRIAADMNRFVEESRGTPG